MAGQISIARANELLDLRWGSGTPASHDVGILKVGPARDGTGYTEVTGGSYARVTLTNNATNWPNASAALKKNGTVITFPTASADWMVDGFGIGLWVGSDLMEWFEFTNPQTILSGQTRTLPINSLIFVA